MGDDSESTHILSNDKTPSYDSKSSANGTQQLIIEAAEVTPERYGVPMTSFNFINSIVGSGVIGIPYMLRQAGIGLGLLVLGFIALVTDYSFMLLTKGGQITNANTYQGVVEAAFGRPGFYVLSVLQFFYPFISMVSYNVIIGDTISKIIQWINGNRSSFVQSVLGNRYVVICVVTLLVTLPLSLYRNIGKLGKVREGWLRTESNEKQNI